ncbi:hypothetical protein BDB01DRAFT_850807 [Pilobolus umbonatus]|nr:hypothetical protein BDB01DRAFT_850807 [Pilobolus umbonatus]
MAFREKIISRINQSRWTKYYIISACLQGITIVILQATIAYFNTAQVNKGLEAYVFDIEQLSKGEIDEFQYAIDRLTRIKWENIAFIGFQFWFVGMSFDATIYQNSAEVIALAIMNLACSVLGALEVIDGKRWLNILTEINRRNGLSIPTSYIQTAFYLEIVLSICVGFFSIIFAYLSYAVVRELGWVIYKKIGADLSIQKMYRVFQLYVLALKIDIFIEFLVSCFYLIQFALKNSFKPWKTYVFVIITLLMLPMLYFGRTAVACESTFRMIVFILFQMLVVFQLVLIVIESMSEDNYWYTWICFVVMGLILAIATSSLAIVCITNFGKGLQPYIQRGSENKQLMSRPDVKRNDPEHWIIDED